MLIKRLILKTLKKFGYKEITRSETSKVRSEILEYCNGYGCDIGFGGDKISKINCDGIDYKHPYTRTGKDKVDIACDLSKETIPVLDDTYDYVYSSHLIEDFEDTRKILIEFLRILKNGGNLILVFPDQPKYEQHCKLTLQPLNQCHIYKNMGLEFIYDCLNKIDTIKYEILYESNCEIDYNVIIVLKITKWEA